MINDVVTRCFFAIALITFLLFPKAPMAQEGKPSEFPGLRELTVYMGEKIRSVVPEEGFFMDKYRRKGLRSWSKEFNLKKTPKAKMDWLKRYSDIMVDVFSDSGCVGVQPLEVVIIEDPITYSEQVMQTAGFKPSEVHYWPQDLWTHRFPEQGDSESGQEYVARVRKLGDAHGMQILNFTGVLGFRKLKQGLWLLSTAAESTLLHEFGHLYQKYAIVVQGSCDILREFEENDIIVNGVDVHVLLAEIEILTGIFPSLDQTVDSDSEEFDTTSITDEEWIEAFFSLARLAENKGSLEQLLAGYSDEKDLKDAIEEVCDSELDEAAKNFFMKVVNRISFFALLEQIEEIERGFTLVGVVPSFRAEFDRLSKRTTIHHLRRAALTLGLNSMWGDVDLFD